MPHRDDNRETRPRRRLLGWVIAGALLAAGAAAWFFLAPDAARQSNGLLNLLLGIGRVFGPLLIGIFVLLLVIRSYPRFFQMTGLIATPLAAISGVVCLLLPAVDSQTGYILLGVAAATLVLFGVSTFCVMFACPQCGSFKSQRHVDSEKLPGYSKIERHYRVCAACGHQWQDMMDRI